MENNKVQAAKLFVYSIVDFKDDLEEVCETIFLCIHKYYDSLIV